MGKSNGASFLSKFKGLTRSGRAHKVPSRLREDDTSQGGGGVGGGDPRGGGGGGEPLEEEEVDYRCLASSGGLSLVHVRLRTGRTHQIRVQFASRGTPLAGDGKYGGGPGEIALWSYRLAFPHPETGRPLAFSSLPQGGLWEEFSLETLLSASI